jgi:hypothetical protein
MPSTDAELEEDLPVSPALKQNVVEDDLRARRDKAIAVFRSLIDLLPEKSAVTLLAESQGIEITPDPRDAALLLAREALEAVLDFCPWCGRGPGRMKNHAVDGNGTPVCLGERALAAVREVVG